MLIAQNDCSLAGKRSIKAMRKAMRRDVQTTVKKQEMDESDCMENEVTPFEFLKTPGKAKQIQS